MSNQISGNTGGAVNAKLFCINVFYGSGTQSLIAYSDANGNYSFTNLAPGTYQIKANLLGATGAFATGYNFHTPQQTVNIQAANPQDVTGVNFTPALINSAN
jgi:hypothetical protein